MERFAQLLSKKTNDKSKRIKSIHIPSTSSNGDQDGVDELQEEVKKIIIVQKKK